MIVCHLCDGLEIPGNTTRQWLMHYDTTHGHLSDLLDVTGPGQDWASRAIEEARRLAATGRRFTFYDIACVVGEPISPKSMWGALAQTVEHMSIAKPVSYQQSERPGSKGSAVRVWQGISHTERNAA